MKRLKIFAAATTVAALAVLGLVLPQTAQAATTALSAHSWDPGMYATTGTYNDSVHAWGKRTTAGAWGTGGVNYQSGATATNRAGSSGSLSVRMAGTYCPGGTCTYGSGSGYKGLVQFWNDPGNFIAFGLIHDPGVSPNGMTLMIEGSAGGRAVGGYFPGGAITGSSHLFTFSWTPGGISVNVDGQQQLGPYPVSMAAGPSVSFLAAARNTGDISDTTFTNIDFAGGSAAASPVSVPAGNPYASIQADVTENGTGTGNSAYLNLHDAHNNAISVGMQSDSSAPESGGQPHFIWERVQNGVFSSGYLQASGHAPQHIQLKWWSNGTAVFYLGNTPIADIAVGLTPRLFFQVEGNGRLNGDTVNDVFSNVQMTSGNGTANETGFSGAWNTSSFNFHGLTATNTNGATQNGASFTVRGTVNGLAAGHNWDTDEVAGIGMIAQFWHNT